MGLESTRANLRAALAQSLAKEQGFALCGIASAQASEYGDGDGDEFGEGSSDIGGEAEDCDY